MNEPTYGEYDNSDVDGIETLKAWIKRIYKAPSPESAADLLSELFMNGHEGSGGYLSFGNKKIASNVAIFNLNSATDCPNAQTEHCQVPWEECYAHVAEARVSPDALDKRRRQEYLWDNVDAYTFAQGLLRVKERKTSSFDYLRLSESGDFRDDQDIAKAERISKMIAPEIEVYTYSASDYLTWDKAETITVNQSNEKREYGDRLYSAVPTEDDIPEDAVHCPYEASDGEVKCGECTACIDTSADDIYITLH